jgi:16S rRNA (guanine527-N7)-methyltransferase
VEPPPEGLLEAARATFGERLPLAQRYVDLLATSAVERGLVGPREAGRLWERHVLNCAPVAALCPPDGDVVDVGSGAGLPGLVLAVARPDLRVTLLEPLLRRVVWLTEVVEELGLDARVVRARAEDSGLRTGTVVARAVAPLERLAALCLPLLRPGGQLLALKGASAPEELAAAVPALRRAGADRWEVLTLPAAGSGPATSPGSTVVRVTVRR